MKTAFVFLVLILALPSSGADGFWVKGNTHTHTNLSDGDVATNVVIEWYKSHGYNFLFITDHNRLTDPRDYAKYCDESFILIGGEEMTSSPKEDAFINALGINRTVNPKIVPSLRETVQNNIAAILAAGGIAQINHPNYHFGLNERVLQQAHGYGLIEVYNGFEYFNCEPVVRNFGDAAHLTAEQIWDVLLSGGKTVFGTSSDDTHHYTKIGPQFANPGRGWIMVRVNKLSEEQVMEGIRKGDFYASNGVELASYQYDGKSIRIVVKPEAGKTYTIRFIGKYGRILHEVDGNEATYPILGALASNYVRVKVICGDGTVAWTQPAR